MFMVFVAFKPGRFQLFGKFLSFGKYPKRTRKAIEDEIL